MQRLAGGPHCLDSPYQESDKGSQCFTMHVTQVLFPANCEVF